MAGSMHFKQFYLGCLSHASYMIGSKGEAAVVDPQRDVDQYITEAKALGLTIRYIIETHLHADFVSGHRELAARTGGLILFGCEARPSFPHRAVVDGEELPLGDLTLRVLATPGHTPDGICVAVYDPKEPGAPIKLLTGDTLFIGDVGRPDLAGALGYTPGQMAGMLYDSLHNKILPLADATEIWPAHGAGSACGRNISRETSSTLGEQRRVNYALQPMPRDAFIAMLTTDLPAPPAYFARDAELNRAGAPALTELPKPEALSATKFAEMADGGAFTLDVRTGEAFGSGHVPGSVNIGLTGQFASWVGSLVPIGSAILLVAEGKEQVAEAVTRLARVGHDAVKGYLEGGMAAWQAEGKPVASLRLMPADELRRRLASGEGLQVLDVRRVGEFGSGHIPDAINVPLSAIDRAPAAIAGTGPVAVICQSGYRSSIAASLLAKYGRGELLNVVGGMNAWNQGEGV